MSIEILAGNGVWVSVGGGLRYVFTGSLLGTTILDGGMRERSNAVYPFIHSHQPSKNPKKKLFHTHTHSLMKQGNLPTTPTLYIQSHHITSHHITSHKKTKQNT